MVGMLQALRTIGVSSAVLMLSAFGGADALQAQVTAQPPTIRGGVRHIRSITPTSGPIGTEIRVWSDRLPRNTRVHVAIGEQHGCGYQVCSTAQTDSRGDLTVTVPAPDWRHWDHFEVVMILNDSFLPIAQSDPFHVTDRDGLIQRRGLVANTWPGCPSLRGSDGLEYALVGAHALTLLATVGKEVIVEGHVVEATCNFQNAMEVVRVDVPPAGSQ